MYHRYGGAHGSQGAWSGWGGGPPPWAEFLRGFAPPHQRTHGGGSRVRRGDVRLAIIDVLAVEPMNGYQVIQQIAERTNGAWKPSPGSVYPTLQQLQDEGLVREAGEGGRRQFQLTDDGRAYVEERREELGTPWDDATRAGERTVVREASEALKGFVTAWRQVMHTGTPAQQARATAVLDDARRSMYGILANDDA